MGSTMAALPVQRTRTSKGPSKGMAVAAGMPRRWYDAMSVLPPTTLRALTYRLPALNDAMISPPPEQFRLEKPRKDPASLGPIDSSPLELLHEMLLLLDLQSVASFRLVNTKAMCIVDSLREYNVLATHAREALWALVATGVASHITIYNLYGLLCAHTCSSRGCSQFGDVLFLPELRRCCMFCLTTASEFMPMLVSEASGIFCVSEERIAARVPVVHTVPGRYTMYKTRYSEKTRFLSRFRVGALYGTRATKKALEHWEEKCLGPHRAGKMRSRGTGGQHHIHRYMCATPFPSFDPVTRKSNRGVFCKGCKLHRVGGSRDPERIFWRPWDVMLSEVQFLEHFKQCGHAQELWRSHEEAESHAN